MIVIGLFVVIVCVCCGDFGGCVGFLVWGFKCGCCVLDCLCVDLVVWCFDGRFVFLVGG